jgi:hypothetical protein
MQSQDRTPFLLGFHSEGDIKGAEPIPLSPSHLGQNGSLSPAMDSKDLRVSIGGGGGKVGAIVQMRV